MTMSFCSIKTHEKNQSRSYLPTYYNRVDCWKSVE